MSRIKNPFSLGLNQPRDLSANLYAQYKAAINAGDYKVANAIAKVLRIPPIPGGYSVVIRMVKLYNLHRLKIKEEQKMSRHKFWEDTTEPKNDYVGNLFYHTGTDWTFGTCHMDELHDARHRVAVALFSGNVIKAYNFLG